MTQTRSSHSLSLWLPVAAYIAFIFWVSSERRPIPGITLIPWADKFWHLAEYTPLGALLARALHRTFLGLSWASVGILVFLGALAVGAGDEFYQSFVPGKVESGWDLLFDLIGAAGGRFLYRWRVARTP